MQEGLISPAQIAAGYQQAVEVGYEKGRQVATHDALQAYALDPTMATAQGVGAHDPMMGIQLGRFEERKQTQLAEQQRGQMVRGLTAAAAQGDPKAMAALWMEDPTMAMKLDDRQAESVKGAYEFISNAAYEIIQRPPKQRAAMWDAYIQQGMQMGLDGLGQYLGKYSDQALNAMVAKADGMKQFQQFQQPDYQAVGEAGLAGFQFGQPIQHGGQAQNFAPTTKQIGGATYYQDPRTGKWFDNPNDISGGAVSNGGGGF